MLLLAFCGVVYIIIAGNINSLATLVLNKGDFIMLCGTFLWAVYGIIVKKAVPIMGPLKLTTYTFLFCALIMAPFAIFAFATTNAFSVGINPYIAVIYMAIFPTVIGYSIQQYAIAQIGPSKASLFINLVPIISTILAVIFLNEHIRSYHLIGATMIITAVIVYNHSGFLIKKDKSVQD